MCKALVTITFAWLLLAVATAQPNPPVLDSAGHPLRPGVQYFIHEVNGGALTLVNRNNSCPLYVGQEDTSDLPVIFTPFFADDAAVAENRDFRVAFSAATVCVQSTAWLNGVTEPATGRRLIVTGSGGGGFGGFFKINKISGVIGGYKMEWCPTDACPICRFRCGSVGVYVENGKKILALDGPAISVVFDKA